MSRQVDEKGAGTAADTRQRRHAGAARATRRDRHAERPTAPGEDSGAQIAPQATDEVLTLLHTKWSAFESSLRTSLERAIDLGKALTAAKASVAHGEFGRLFSDHRDPVEGALPFTGRWAQKLIKVASHEVIANTNHGSHLPADLNAVAELSLMTAPALEAAIKSGDVTPQTTREEARALRKGEPRVKVEREPDPPRDPGHELAEKFSDLWDWLSEFLEAHPRKRAAARVFARNLNDAFEDKARDAMSREFGCDRRELEMARMIQATDTELFEQVKAGTVNVFDAARKAIDMAEGALVARPPP